MKVSELIIKLKELKEIHGDVEVFVRVITNYGDDVDDEVPILTFIETEMYEPKKRFIRIT